MTHAGHAWAPTGTPGRCLEGVTPGSAGIFSALSYFVAETPIIFCWIQFEIFKCVPYQHFAMQLTALTNTFKQHFHSGVEKKKTIALKILKHSICL